MPVIGSGWLLIAQTGCLAQAVAGVIFEQRSLNEVMPELWTLLVIAAARALLAWASEQVAHQAERRIEVEHCLH